MSKPPRLLIASHPDRTSIANWKVGRYIIGRNDDVDVYIPSTEVSRHHAIIEVGLSTVFLRDLDSRNGTFVEGVRISSNTSAKLQSGSRLSFGTYPATYVYVPEQIDGTPRQAVLCLGCRYVHRPDEPYWQVDFEDGYP